ncbi:hypothetical protein A3K73_02135 [Candidatus Pacearchaeota archaeon RBG_13_36_9]|nr:MAG: hypothetical protein A3K73_02135 [Candidatus Pacearchaeota archaeon RBG_13_36_9]
MQYKISVEELCMKLKPVFGKKMDDLYLKYAMADSLQEKEEIEHFLNVLYKKHLSELLDKKVLLEPPAKENMDGDYNLAMISYAGKKLFPFNLREKDWMRHVCISGMSGSGKTTLAFHIANNFIQKKKPFLIFDWKKSFRPLLLADPEILLFTVGNENISNYFKININEPPPGISPKEWINVLCDLITESFFASYGVHKILLETLDEAYRDFGVYNGSKNYPTWNEIKWRLDDKLEKKKGREASWLMSAMRIAHIMTFGNFGKCLNYKGKDIMNVDDLLKKKVIFELNTLGTVEKKFFCEFVLTYIYKFKKARQTGINDNFDHAIIVDEAHNIFLKEKTHFTNESVTDMIYREMREYGTSLICLDQHISKISDTVSGNSACLIAFQQQLPQDIDAVSGLMQLRENRNYFSMLPVGSAIVKLSERYAMPFLVEVENVELRSREVSDYDVKGKMKFIFESKQIEEGKDEEFRKEIISPKSFEEMSKEKKKQEEARVPRHPLFNGDAERFRNAQYSRIGKDDSFKNLDRLQEVPRMIYVDTKQAEPEAKKKVSRVFGAQREELSEVQKILYGFVEKKLNMGWHINMIERMLEENAIEGNYSIADVFNVINYALKNRLNNKEANNLKAGEEIKAIPKQQEPKPAVLKPANNPQTAVNSYTLPAFTFVTQPVNMSKLVSEPKPADTLKTKPATGTQIPEFVTTPKIQNNKVYKEIVPVENEDNNNSEEKFLDFLKKNPNHTYTTTEIYNMLGFSARKGNKIRNELLSAGKIKIEEIKNPKGWKKLIRLK